jgi:cell division protein FtsI (penicillin-binding protein 3)
VKARERTREKQWLRLRLWLVGGIFACAFVVLLGRAVHVQIIQQEELSARAQGEFRKHVEIVPRRGIIYDRNQEELAVSLDTHSVYASPLKITQPRQVGRKLAKALGLNARDVIKRLKGERGFVWIARRISPDKAGAVKDLELNGVGLVMEPRRFYPYTTLACHVLGFSGLDARGLEGLEKGYDRVLKGQSHTLTSLRDALGRTIHLTPAAFTQLPEGNHLILTLDKRLQYSTEKILTETVAKYKAKGGQAIVMIPQTGEILAMASLPVFNPNVFGSYPTAAYRNRTITDTYEPGSTFKTFAAAAALMSHKVSLDQLFDCEKGAWRIGGRTIHDTHEYDKLNLADIIKFSSNIGAAKVGQVVGKDDLYRAIRAFGFGQPSGVDLPGESRGILRPASGWRPVELANICFGQGVAVTALQMVQAFAAIANGGVLMRPYVVRAEVDSSGHLISETQPRVVRRVMGAREARILSGMLQRVTEEGGTGTKARVGSLPVAGKTGTAQKVNPSGGYSRSDYMSSFIGFLPADDPQVVVMVVIDTPRGKHYGGTVAGPAFSQTARAALDVLGLQPDSPLQLAQAPAQASAKPAEKSPGLEGELAGMKPERLLALGIVPDLRGYTLRQVLMISGKVRLSLDGWGRVVAQDPEPGKPVGKGLSLRLAPLAGGA